MQAIIENNLEQIRTLCNTHFVKELYLFGSATSNSFSTKSDIDFLYDFDTSKIDFDNLATAPYDYADNFFHFEKQLKKLLKRKVDLIPIKYLKNKYFIESINKNKVKLY